MKKLYDNQETDTPKIRYGQVFWRARMKRYEALDVSISHDIKLMYTNTTNRASDEHIFETVELMANKIADTDWRY